MSDIPSDDTNPILSNLPKHDPDTKIDTAVSSPIEEFMGNYWREHYKGLAKRAQDLLSTALKDARDSDKVEVQCRITYRVKTEKSLRDKLERRNKRRSYINAKSIAEDVKDIAGVRVVLYTPNKAQRLRVKKAVEGIWGKNLNTKIHGISSSRSKAKSSLIGEENDSDDDDAPKSTSDDEDVYVPSHIGYQAEHYRVQMLKEHSREDKSYEHKSPDWVEIQVVSALGHVWAEASHDIMYKTNAYGNPTKLEHRILDALSGLVKSGDLLLEEFRESVTKRTYARWKYPEEFTIWLRESDVMKQKEKEDRKPACKSLITHFSRAGTDILFEFLREVDKNYPIAVRDELKALNFPDDPEAGLETECATFGPQFNPPHGLRAPLCIISLLMRKTPLRIGQCNARKKCSTMMDTFILLQKFCGTAAAAKEYLVKNVKDDLSKEQFDSIKFVLNNILRQNFLDETEGFSVFDPAQTLQAGWDWFVQQAGENNLCGLLFRLATMGVLTEEMGDPAEDKGFEARLEQLQIKSLS